MADSLFTVLFPTSCPLCNQELTEAGAVDICRNCWQSLTLWTGPICSRCGLPFASERALDAATPACGLCREEVMAFDGARAYSLYAGALRDVILRLKFHGRRRLGVRLGELLSVFWPWVEESCAGEEPVLLPVPLHAKRERERGFNQAEILARGLRDKVAKARAGKGTAVERRCVRRVRATLPQTGLSLRQRQENVRGVFLVAAPERVRDRVVVLVDDVLTTGATVSACSAALRRAGASKILVLTLARASPQFPDQAPSGSGVPVDDAAPEWR